MDANVAVSVWPYLALPSAELHSALTYLSLKTKKPVRCAAYDGRPLFRPDCVNVYFATPNVFSFGDEGTSLVLNGRKIELDRGQFAIFTSSNPDFRWPAEISDDDDTLLAKVNYNCIVVVRNILSVDNDAARDVLAFIVERAITLLNFDTRDVMKNAENKIKSSYASFHEGMISSLVRRLEGSISYLERGVEDAYYKLISDSRQLSLDRMKLEVARKMTHGSKKLTAEINRRARGLVDIFRSGKYEDVDIEGSVFRAMTCPVEISHDGHLFRMGRYRVSVCADDGRITINSADGRDANGYCHPHITSEGDPCLGTIAADIAKGIADLRLAEVLMALYDFLCSYNKEAPYIKIGRFDPSYSGDEDSCDGCDEAGTPHCIFECSENNERYSCADCYDYRNDYCYSDCRYNGPHWNYVHPCDDCDKDIDICALKCEHNASWKITSPCLTCEKSTKDDMEACDGCRFADKRKEIECEK